MLKNIIKKPGGQDARGSFHRKAARCIKKSLLVLFISVAATGSAVAQAQVEIKYTDLPKDAQKYVAKNFKDYKVDKVEQGNDKKGKMAFCDVYISKGAEKQKLIFDKDGEFIKQVAVAEAPAAAPAKTPPPAKEQAAPPDTVKK